MSKVKLTKPQMDLLRELERHRSRDWPFSVSESYRPALKLVELKLAEWHHNRLSSALHISSKGLDLLREASQ